MSGYSDQNHKEMCIQAGMEKALQKPVDAQILKKMIENYNLPKIDKDLLGTQSLVFEEELEEEETGLERVQDDTITLTYDSENWFNI